jgi:hypothetical protein
MKRSTSKNSKKKVFGLSPLCGLLTLIYFVVFPLRTYAQLFNSRNESNTMSPNDSLKKFQNKTDDNIHIVCFTQKDTARLALDSSIQCLHKNPLLSIWDIDLGNFASSSQSICFNPSLAPNRISGFQTQTHFKAQWPNFKYYNTTRPHTNLYYRLGSKQEQIIEVSHTQNPSPNWNITASYAKIGSPGMYKLQKTNHDVVKLSTHYMSNNKRYNLFGGLAYNKIQQDENGGILYDSLLQYVEYNNKRLLPVRLGQIEKNSAAMKNYYREASVNVEHSYFVGKTTIAYNKDSAEKTTLFKPIFGVKHTLYSTFEYQRFKDLLPDSLFYNKLNQKIFLNNDTIVSRYYTTQIGNQFMLQSNVTWKEKLFQIEAGYGIELASPQTKNFNAWYVNNFLIANLHKSAYAKKEWMYDAHAKFYFSGNAIGNLHLHAEAGRKFDGKLGILHIGFDQTIQQSPYIFSYYQSNFYVQQNKFNKQTITCLSGEYANTFLNIKLGVKNYLMRNYFYRDTNLSPKQFTNAIPLLQAHLDKQFRIRSFVFDQSYLYQQVSNKSPIHLPQFSLRFRIAYENYIFKKKLQIATGIDVRYNTPFYIDQYNPIFNAFVPQYGQRFANVPQTSYFFNFKVKRYRASISFDELQQIFTTNNINYPSYPAQNFIMRFGFHWVFIN